MLSYALELTQEWGRYWLKPIQDRLAVAYCKLTHDELDYYNRVAQSVMKYGHDLAYSMAKSLRNDTGRAVWEKAYLMQFLWADEQSMRHLISTGMYYAWKDGSLRGRTGSLSKFRLRRPVLSTDDHNSSAWIHESSRELKISQGART